MEANRRLCMTLLLSAILASGAHAEICRAPTEGGFRFTGLNPAIEGKQPLSSFKPGQVVEIDPVTMPAAEGRTYIKALQDLGARVSIYLVGGHCDHGKDCDDLASAGVTLGPTGSWNWDKSERRILDITHPAVEKRLARGIANGWMLGANYIRLDNLHHPSGSTRPRDEAQMRRIIGLAHEIEDQLRADGTISADKVTGVVAHNNLVTWEKLMETGALRRPPAFLTSERTAQLAAGSRWEGDQKMKAGKLEPTAVAEVEAGRRLAAKLGVPYSIVEFGKSHDLGQPGRTYPFPRSYAEAASKLDGVSEVIVMTSEDHYVGRPEVLDGRGPRTLLSRPCQSAS